MIEKFRNADNSSSQGLDLCIQNEVHTYLHVTDVNSGQSALQFWKTNATFYPNLSVLAKNYFVGS
jgi:hypothetical protein